MPDASLWQLGASALGGGGLSSLLTFLNQRSRARSYAMGAVDHAIETALKSVTGEVDRLNTKIEQVEAKHEVCEHELQASRDERAELRAQIAVLMAGPVAPFGAKPPPDI